MKSAIVFSYQSDLFGKAETKEEKRFIKCFFPVLYAANSRVMGYLMHTPIMEIRPSSLLAYGSRSFRERLIKSIFNEYSTKKKDSYYYTHFSREFWAASTVKDFFDNYEELDIEKADMPVEDIKSFSKKEIAITDNDFISIRGGDLVDQAQNTKPKEVKTTVGRKETAPVLSAIIKKQMDRLEESEQRIKDIKKDLNTDILKAIKSFEEEHGIEILEFESGGYTFDRKLIATEE